MAAREDSDPVDMTISPETVGFIISTARRFDAVVVAVPAEQAAVLLSPAATLAEAMRQSGFGGVHASAVAAPPST